MVGRFSAFWSASRTKACLCWVSERTLVSWFGSNLYWSASLKKPKILLTPSLVFSCSVITQEVIEEELNEHFGQLGEIESVNLKTDPNTGCSRGFCLVVYKVVLWFQHVVLDPYHYSFRFLPQDEEEGEQGRQRRQRRPWWRQRRDERGLLIWHFLYIHTVSCIRDSLWGTFLALDNFQEKNLGRSRHIFQNFLAPLGSSSSQWKIKGQSIQIMGNILEHT